MLKKGILAFMMISTLALANPVKIVFDVHTGVMQSFSLS